MQDIYQGFVRRKLLPARALGEPLSGHRPDYPNSEEEIFYRFSPLIWHPIHHEYTCLSLSKEYRYEHCQLFWVYFPWYFYGIGFLRSSHTHFPQEVSLSNLQKP